MTKHVTAHGFPFVIDTDDWGHNQADGDRGADYLETWLSNQSYDRIAAIWITDQLFGNRWTNDLNVPSKHWQAKVEAEACAMLIATTGWHSNPTTGHNMAICATPRIDEIEEALCDS